MEGKRGVRVLGPPSAARAKRAPTIAFTVDGTSASSFPPRLDERRIAVRYGHFYAYRAIRALGLLERDGVVRASLAHYNTPAEVERLTEALDELL
jgi:selenocysteine lyase/cysteine desulfurase